MKRSSTAVWKGSGKEGKGTISSQSHAIDNAPYAWNTRFENKPGTNPEELIAAAHAGCFTMKLSFLLTEAGFVPGISNDKFEECARNSKDNCPVSKALNMMITMDATLMEKTMA